MRSRFPLSAAALCAAMLALPAVSGAQGPTPPATPPAVELTPGTRVQFVDPWHDGGTVEGQVTRRWGDSVTVHADGELSPTDYRLADLRSLSVSQGRPVAGSKVAHGALLGAIGGAVAGSALLGFMYAHQSSPEKRHLRATDVGVSAGFGMIAGALAGMLHAPERWRAVSAH